MLASRRHECGRFALVRWLVLSLCVKFFFRIEEMSVDTGCTTLRFLSKRLPPLLNASLTSLALILAPSRPFLVLFL